jgi:hypothetical protein
MSPLFSPSRLSKHPRTGSVCTSHHLRQPRQDCGASLSHQCKTKQYTGGTTTRFWVMTMEALAPWPHHRIPHRYPQYHMSTYSTSHWVNSPEHLLDRRLRRYCRGHVPRVPRVTGYSLKIWIRSVPSSGKQMRNLSYLVFMPKPSTHCMLDPGSIVPHIRSKVITDNQMSRIRYNYYINNVSKHCDDSKGNGIVEDSITQQEQQAGQHVA